MVLADVKGEITALDTGAPIGRLEESHAVPLATKTLTASVVEPAGTVRNIWSPLSA